MNSQITIAISLTNPKIPPSRNHHHHRGQAAIWWALPPQPSFGGRLGWGDILLGWFLLCHWISVLFGYLVFWVHSRAVPEKPIHYIGNEDNFKS